MQGSSRRRLPRLRGPRRRTRAVVAAFTVSAAIVLACELWLSVR